MSRRQFIEIPMTKCRIFLSEPEFLSLLAKDPELWATAIKRGKAILRTRQARERQGTEVDPPEDSPLEDPEEETRAQAELAARPVDKKCLSCRRECKQTARVVNCPRYEPLESGQQ